MNILKNKITNFFNKMETKLYDLLQWENDDEGKPKVWLYIAVFLIFIFLMFLLNNYTVFTSDDYRYNYIFDSYLPSDNSTRVENVFDIITSMASHYKMWGGRIVAHSFVQGFLIFPKVIFNIFNTAAFILLGYLIFLHATKKRCGSLSIFILIYSLLFLLLPFFGQTVLWLSGSCNYLWCTLLILLALLPFRFYREQNKKSYYLTSLLSLIAGCTNENTGMTLVFLMALFMIYYYLSEKKIRAWIPLNIISAFVGSIICIVAPGNAIRSSTYPSITFQKILQNFITISKHFIEHYSFLIFSIIMLCTLYLLLIKEKRQIRKLVIPTFYLIGAIISVLVLVVSPLVSPRSYFFAITCLIIVLINIISLLKTILPYLSKLICIGTVFIFVVFGYYYFYAFLDIKKTYYQIEKEINMIEVQKREGKKNIFVIRHKDSVNKYNAITGTANLTHNKEDWYTAWYAKYYDVDSIDY